MKTAFLLVTAMAWAAPRGAAQADSVERRVSTMGTVLHIQVEAADRAEALRASELALGSIESVAARLSTWSEDSELARLNRAPVGELFRPSPELARDLERARELWRETDGALEPGIGALVRAWGLRSGGRVPSEDEIRVALESGGLAALEWVEGGVRRSHPGLLLEEGGFGKGIALDAALASLRASGARSAILDLGGQVCVRSPRVERFELADPRERQLGVLEIEIQNGSFATSGNSEHLGHLLDPRTGRPLESAASVTVFASDATRADGLSTALFVMGPDAALAWAAAHADCEVIVLEPAGTGILARASSGLRGRLRALTPDARLAFEPDALQAAAPRQDSQGTEQRLQRLEQENRDLHGELDALADELERFSLSDGTGADLGIGARHSGLAPSASKVYGAGSGVSIGGYGEALYSDPSGGSATADFLRAVLYFGYHFSEQWLFNSELEVEHASTGRSGEVSVEFAYLDWLHSSAFNLRTGLVLIPMGWLNELHEPTTFLSVARPKIEQRILPSTWRENGIGVYGDVGELSYRAYVVNGLDASGFSAAGLRGGRQKGSKALAEDLAVTARLDWTATPGLVVGGSLYMADSGQGQAGLGGVGTSIYELHAEYKAAGWWARALASLAELDGTAQLNSALGKSGTQAVGEQLEGMYVELGYDLMRHIDSGSSKTLIPFVRWEALDTQARVGSGFTADPANDERIVTFGVHFRPLDQVVFKMDYEDSDRGSDRFNIGMGYAF
jgi:thiamine biosynthesis lipoprotein ApbE